jgi:hypothetical protein
MPGPPAPDAGMIACPFGWTGVPVPVIGQGTRRMGEGRAPRRQEVAAIRLGIEFGMTRIDTAEMYGDGGAEAVVAEAVAGRRDRVFIATKVLPSNASYEGTIRACQRSLKRLRTDYVDLYLLHWWSARHPIAETMRAMEELVARGLVRFIGVSNLDVGETRAAEQARARAWPATRCSTISGNAASSAPSCPTARRGGWPGWATPRWPAAASCGAWWRTSPGAAELPRAPFVAVRHSHVVQPRPRPRERGGAGLHTLPGGDPDHRPGILRPDFDTKRCPFASLQPRSARRCKSQPGYSREKS